jgi:hypothetical protein
LPVDVFRCCRLSIPVEVVVYLLWGGRYKAGPLSHAPVAGDSALVGGGRACLHTHVRQRQVDDLLHSGILHLHDALVRPCLFDRGGKPFAGKPALDFVFDRLIMPLLLRNVYDDTDRQEAIIRRSNLDWTLIRPMVLRDKQAGDKIEALVDLTDVHGGSISRAAVAWFLVRELTGMRWVRQAPLIKN